MIFVRRNGYVTELMKEHVVQETRRTRKLVECQRGQGDG